MKARTARWVAGCAAAGAVALIGGGLALAYVNRHLVPADLTGWTFSDVSGQVVNIAVPVAGFVLASRRPGNRIGWLFLVAGLALGLFGLSNQYALHAVVADRGSLPAGQVFAWLSNWVWVAAATLAAAALFNPVRRRVQQMVDRRFNRARYDAEQTVAAFAARLKDTVDPHSVRDDLAMVVAQSLEPAHVSVWISEQG
jgi:hypothetical protein